MTHIPSVENLNFRHTVGAPNLYPILYRTVPYRFPLQFLSRSRSLSARRTVFPVKKSKARTVPYLKLRPF
jgi:hypothetical protein